MGRFFGLRTVWRMFGSFLVAFGVGMWGTFLGIPQDFACLGEKCSGFLRTWDACGGSYQRLTLLLLLKNF